MSYIAVITGICIFMAGFVLGVILAIWIIHHPELWK